MENLQEIAAAVDGVFSEPMCYVYVDLFWALQKIWNCENHWTRYEDSRAVPIDVLCDYVPSLGRLSRDAAVVARAYRQFGTHKLTRVTCAGHAFDGLFLFEKWSAPDVANNSSLTQLSFFVSRCADFALDSQAVSAVYQCQEFDFSDATRIRNLNYGFIEWRSDTDSDKKLLPESIFTYQAPAGAAWEMIQRFHERIFSFKRRSLTAADRELHVVTLRNWHLDTKPSVIWRVCRLFGPVKTIKLHAAAGLKHQDASIVFCDKSAAVSICDYFQSDKLVHLDPKKPPTLHSNKGDIPCIESFLHGL